MPTPPFALSPSTRLRTGLSKCLHTLWRGFDKPVLSLSKWLSPNGSFRDCAKNSQTLSRSALVEEDAHLCDRKGTVCCVLAYCTRLGQRGAGEQLCEFTDGNTVFQVLEQRPNRHARAAEHPGHVDALGVALNSCTGRPIDHARHRSTGEIRIGYPCICDELSTRTPGRASSVAASSAAATLTAAIGRTARGTSHIAGVSRRAAHTSTLRVG